MKKFCKFSRFDPVVMDNGASVYCMKDDSRLEGPWEFGSKPLRQNVAVECKMARSQKNMRILTTDLGSLVRDGDIDIHSVPVLKRAKDIIAVEEAMRNVVSLSGDLHSKNVWLWGPAGIGKTGWFVDYFTSNGGYYNKEKNKYWNCYNNEDNVMINDIELNESHQLGNLKRWAEHTPFLAEDKYGGFTKIRPQHICVTSNYHPQEIWTDHKELAPILRRFKVVRMLT